MIDPDFVFPSSEPFPSSLQPAAFSFPRLEFLHKQIAHRPNQRREKQRAPGRCGGPQESRDVVRGPPRLIPKYKKGVIAKIPTIRRCHRELFAPPNSHFAYRQPTLFTLYFLAGEPPNTPHLPRLPPLSSLQLPIYASYPSFPLSALTTRNPGALALLCHKSSVSPQFRLRTYPTAVAKDERRTGRHPRFIKGGFVPNSPHPLTGSRVSDISSLKAAGAPIPALFVYVAPLLTTPPRNQ